MLRTKAKVPRGHGRLHYAREYLSRYGMKTDGMLPVAGSQGRGSAIPVKAGDKIQVTITGRDEEATTSFRDQD